MRSTTTLMKNWQFTGPDGKTVTVDLRLLARQLHL